MGTDINGFIEIKSDWMEHWKDFCDISFLVSRSIEMFGMLFGVRNSTDFAPIIPTRGLPIDSSPRVKRCALFMHDMSIHHHTFATYKELAAINWSEAALDGSARGYRSPEDKYPITGKRLASNDERRRDGAVWIEKDSFFNEMLTYRVFKVTRYQLAEECGFDTVLMLMKSLAEKNGFGEEAVRLVVYFDS